MPAETGSQRLRRWQRLSGREDFKRPFVEGTSLRSGWLGLKVRPNRLGRTRFGCTVRRKVATGGVLRNRLRRLAREAFRRNRQAFPVGLDLVVIVLESPPEISYHLFEEALLRLGRQCVSAQKSYSGSSGSTKRSGRQG